MKNVYTKLGLLTFLLSSWIMGAAQYCSPSYTNDWESIQEVSLTNGTTNLTSRSVLWDGNSNGYSDYTTGNPREYVCTPGTTVNYRISTNPSNTINSGLTAWIDWAD